MISKKLFFITLTFLALTHCGLEIGELPPSVPVYRMNPAVDACSKLDYKKEFISYFFNASIGEQENNPVQSKWPQVLHCIRVKAEEANDLFKNESLNKQEFINLLNQEFVRTENMAPVIDHITQKEYFDHYIFIKSMLIRLIERSKTKDLSSESICQKPESESVLTKQEVRVFLSFLGDSSQLFYKLEKSSQEVFEQFVQYAPHVNLNSSLHFTSHDYFKDHFIVFLSDYLQNDFPEYSIFLKQLDGLDELVEEKAGIRDGFIPEISTLGNGAKASQEDVLEPLVDIARLLRPMTVHNVKYMMLNIYLMQAFFSVYDLNQDSILSPEELIPLSCIINPIVSVVVPSWVKKIWSFGLYNTEAVANYIIRHQKWHPGGYLIYRLFEEPDELESLSYVEVSRLIAFFLSQLFETVDEKLSEGPESSS